LPGVHVERNFCRLFEYFKVCDTLPVVKNTFKADEFVKIQYYVSKGLPKTEKHDICETKEFGDLWSIYQFQTDYH
jgi:hypothetical protein